MSRLSASTRYFGALLGSCAVIALSLAMLLEAPASAPVEEAPVIARFQQQTGSDGLRFRPGDFDISRSVPVRIKSNEPPVTQAALPKTKPVETLPGRAAVVEADGVNLRSAPSVQSRRLEVLRAGLAVRVLETERSWSRIVTEDGRSGWLASKFLSS